MIIWIDKKITKTKTGTEVFKTNKSNKNTKESRKYESYRNITIWQVEEKDQKKDLTSNDIKDHLMATELIL